MIILDGKLLGIPSYFLFLFLFIFKKGYIISMENLLLFFLICSVKLKINNLN